LSSADWSTFNGKYTLPSLTNGSVLFSNGTTIAQDSTNLIWDNGNKRLGIGISTPLSTLDVVGTLKVSSTTILTGSVGIGGSPSGVFGKLSVFGGISMKNDNSAKLEIGRYSAGFPHSYIKIGDNASSLRIGNAADNSELITLFNSTGNLLISSEGGGQTDAGFKLDVNGTARVSSKITGRASLSNSNLFDDYAIKLNGISTTDTTTRILIECGTLNSQGIGYGARALNATIDGYGVGTFVRNNTSNSAIGHVVVTGSNNSLAIPAFAAQTNGQTAGGSIGYIWMDGNTQCFFHSIMHNQELRLYNPTGTIYFIRDRLTTNITFGANTHYASAQLAIDSTTKGFLPPRMTNAQRTAITSPAVGLMVYCTDTVEGLYIYKSTGWTFVI
jgi:hypothetical protein